MYSGKKQMNKKHYITILPLCLLSLGTQAQTALTKSNNSFVDGDRLQLQHVELPKDAYDEGQHLWDFSRMRSLETESRRRFVQKGDSSRHGMACREDGIRYDFSTADDGLVLEGYEDMLTRMMYDQGEQHLRFPMRPGDVMEGCYHGRGIYCNRIALRNYGNYRTEAIAVGSMLTPEGDTLRNVMLLHTDRMMGMQHYPDTYSDSLAVFTDDSVRMHLATDSTLIKSVTERWYAYGYRYPILETRQMQTPQGEPVSEQLALYCPPYVQSALTDSENEQIRQLLACAANSDAGNGSCCNSNSDGMGNNGNSTNGSVMRNVHIAVDGRIVTVICDLTEDAFVTALICTVSGMLEFQHSQHSNAGTDCQVQLDCSCLRSGQHVLYMNVNGQVTSYTVKLS
jgi:hypothetical protein